MALYRLQQGLRALTARARSVDLRTARAYLAPRLMGLFLRMRRSEQQHSLNVLRTLRAAGLADLDLMTAALLHDVGKCGVPYRLWDRVLVVSVHKLSPRRAAAWGVGAPIGWRRPFVVAAQHAAWSVQMVRAAGGSARAVEIIARHHDRLGTPSSETERLIAALIEADGAN